MISRQDLQDSDTRGMFMARILFGVGPTWKSPGAVQLSKYHKQDSAAGANVLSSSYYETQTPLTLARPGPAYYSRTCRTDAESSQ